MRNTKKYFRKAIFDLLNGNISVPVYDEKRKVEAPRGIFVVLSTQQETPAPEDNDCTFVTRSSIDIEIVVKTGFEVTKDAQDDIEDEILAILRPTQGSDIVTSSGFLIQDLFRERSFTRNLSLSDSQSILQTILTFTATITEQT